MPAENLPLDNYTDLSVGGSDLGTGFQFEFRCSHCSQRWRSPFKPYRMGQLTGLLTRFAFMFTDMRSAGRATGNFADMGSRGAKDEALQEAMVRAMSMYTVCQHCKQAVCGECYDSRQDSCTACIDAARKVSEHDEQQAVIGAICPNCRAAHAGGRFCGECGFDMASTHKSCPACGVMTQRNARFCTDCGHSF